MPRADQLFFDNDAAQAAAFAQHVSDLQWMGTVTEIDFAPFYAAALLLYKSPRRASSSTRTLPEIVLTNYPEHSQRFGTLFRHPEDYYANIVERSNCNSEHQKRARVL